MDFNKFSKYSQFKEIFQNMTPEMKEEVLKNARTQMKLKIEAVLKKYLSQPVLILAGLFIGIIVGALSACFGDILLKLSLIRESHPFYFIPFLGIAGLCIAIVYKKWGGIANRGMELVFAVGQGKEQNIPLRQIPLIALSTWVTHLFGGSAGREGVAMQIGATFGQNISKKIPVENAGKILLIAGMAAGFAGLFQVPMASSAFALEVLIVGRLEFSALLPTVVAAFAACKVSNMLGLEKFAVDLDALLENSISLFNAETSINVEYALKLSVLGIFLGLLGAAFSKSLQISQGYFSKKIQNPVKRIVIMGVSLSVILLICAQGRYAGLGTNLIDFAFSGKEVYAFDWILKFALTVLTLAAGFKGGEVTPIFSIGATFGAVFSAYLGLPLPLAAALGYTALFGSATNTILAPVLIGVEVFGTGHISEFFIVCTLAYSCNFGQSIYRQQKMRLKH